MAERTLPTALLFQNASRHLQGHGSATVFAYLSLCGEAMGGFTKATTDFTDEQTREAVGPTLATTDDTDDTVVMTKADWAPGADEIFGAGVFITLEGADLQIFHEWAASVVFEVGDTVTETINLQSKTGA